MQYQQYAPPPPLARYVRCVWTLAGVGSGNLERVLPDACTEMLLHLGTPHNWPKQSTEAAAVAGQLTQALVLEAPAGPFAIIGIRFWPWGLTAFTRVPQSELADRRVSLFELIGAEANELIDRYDINELGSAAKQLVRLLMRRIASNNTAGIQQNRQLEAAVRLAQAPERVPLAVIADRVNLSPRQLERRFVASVGLTAQHISAVARLQRAVALLQRRTPLTQAALEAGYYDQAHLNRAFQRLVGLSPTRYLAEQHQMNDFFTSDVAFVQSG